MEDMNMLAVDGIVICCCCPCLILQIIIFILLKLPYRLVKKSKRLVHNRLCRKKKNNNNKMKNTYENIIKEIERRQQISGKHISNQGVPPSSSPGCRAIEEAEKVMEELSKQGKFAFGSFWGREEQGCTTTAAATSSSSIEEFDYDDTVFHHLVELIKSCYA